MTLRDALNLADLTTAPGFANLSALDRDDLLALGELVSQAREATLAVFDTYASAPVIGTCEAPITRRWPGEPPRC
jgi:hypothetical protein